MNTTKRKAIEAAGWKIGDAADFLGMSHEEGQMLDARVELAMEVRRLREAQHLPLFWDPCRKRRLVC